MPPLAAIDRELATRRLAEFVRLAWAVVEPATPLVWGWHMDAVCEHLEAVSLGQLRNLAIMIPPGSSKSTIVSVMWPVWDWLRHPARRFLTASYSLALATRDALRSRRIIASPWFHGWWGDRFVLTGDQNAKTRYENSLTGSRIALSVGSATTGERGDITAIDDAHNVAEAESDAVREGTIRWHDEAFFNRINDPRTGGRVVMGQRVHHRDLIGHLVARGGWVELRIPEEFEPDRRCVTSLPWQDPRQAPGELMRPERFGLEQVAEAKANLGGLGYAAQHQQNPTPREGAVFKKEWLRHFTRFGSGYALGGPAATSNPANVLTAAHLQDLFLTVDTAASVKETAKSDPDWTAVSAWCLARGRLLWLGCARRRLEVPDIPKFVAEMYVRYRAKRAFVEGGGTQKAAPQLLRRHESPRMNVIELQTSHQGDKLQRAHHALVMAEAGNLWLPEDDPAFPRDVVETELLSFTGDGRGGHDDIFDTFGMAGRVAEKHALPTGGGSVPQVVGGSF